MKVALVCDWFLPRIGGIELHLRDLAQRLNAGGHDARIITTTRGADEVDDVRVHRVPAVLAPRYGFAVSATVRSRIQEVLQAERFDVVHCHVSIVSPAAIAGAIAARHVGARSVVTFHSVVPQMRHLSRGAGALFGTRRWNATFTAVSGWVARQVQPFARQPVVVLPNGVDSASWRVTPRPRNAGGVVELVSVMRLNAKKRPFALVDAIDALVRRRHAVSGDSPYPHIRLRIAGDGPERGRLERAIRARSLGDHVQLLGPRTRAEVRELLSECDLFVLPAVRESFGLAAIEARCAGLPVVAMANTGLGEWIHDGVEGLLATSDSGLAAQIERLVRNADLRAAISAHNRTTIPSCDWRTVVTQHEQVYAGNASVIPT